MRINVDRKVFSGKGRKIIILVCAIIGTVKVSKPLIDLYKCLFPQVYT